MKIYVALITLAIVAYCQAADKAYGAECTSSDKCLGDTTCQKRYDGCTKMFCACKSGYVQKSGNTCEKVTVTTLKKIGESCSSTSDCYGSYRSCTSSKCTCNTGYIASDDKLTCGRYVGMTCSTDTDCGSWMECPSSKKCACKAAYKEEEKLCTTYDLGDDCSGSKTCSSPGTCQSNKCACTNSLVAYLDNECVHKDATKDIKKGKTCTGLSATPATSDKLCGKNLRCVTCPGETAKVCTSSSPSTKTGLITVLLAAVMAIFRQ